MEVIVKDTDTKTEKVEDKKEALKVKQIAPLKERKKVEKTTKNEGKIYIAYGSNMDLGRMFKRCPNAEYYGTGLLEGYKLTFQKSCSGYYCSLIKSKKDIVPVVLFKITQDDERRLDFYEGFPEQYRKYELEVWTETDKLVTGIAYILPSNREYGIPTLKYYTIISSAYKVYNFDISMLTEALTRSYKKAKKKKNEKLDIETSDVNTVSTKTYCVKEKKAIKEKSSLKEKIKSENKSTSKISITDFKSEVSDKEISIFFKEFAEETYKQAKNFAIAFCEDIKLNQLILVDAVTQEPYFIIHPRNEKDIYGIENLLLNEIKYYKKVQDGVSNLIKELEEI